MKGVIVPKKLKPLIEIWAKRLENPDDDCTMRLGHLYIQMYSVCVVGEIHKFNCDYSNTMKKKSCLLCISFADKIGNYIKEENSKLVNKELKKLSRHIQTKHKDLIEGLK